MTDIRPMRFCMVTTFYPPYNFGGDGIFVQRLSNELARRGHHVEVVHCIDSYRLLAGRKPAARYQDHPNMIIHALKSPFGPLSPIATHQSGFPFLKSRRVRQILDQNFDVIHYHNVSLVGGPKILEYGSGIKLYSMHEYWLVCPTHMLFRFNRDPCTERHCFGCTLAYRRPPQWWRHFGLLEAAIRHIDVFVAPTQFSKRMHQQLGLKAPIVHLPLFVPHGAVEDPFPGRLSDELRDFPRQPYFLFVGRLEKLKGLQTLIPIFRRYQKAQLWVAGEGAYEPYLRRLAAGSDNIRFLGRRTGNDLQALYREARAVIVPSICFEVFSLVVIEAFRHQTPVIVRNIGGMPEIVQEAGGGYVYDNDDELLSAMDQVLHQPSHRRNLGLNGYAAYLEKWTADAHLKSYFALIGQIAAARSEFSVEREALLSSRVS